VGGRETVEDGQNLEMQEDEEEGGEGKNLQQPVV
jgi:hypothetical protein